MEEFRDSFDRVQILNEFAGATLRLNNIDPINRTVQPLVDLQGPSLPLTFDIVRDVKPTLIDVDSASPLTELNGTIENPIGTTSIVVPAGNVRATHGRGVPDPDGRLSLIRTNVLDIETPAGGVGQSDPRVNVDVVDGGGLPQPTNFFTVRVSALEDSIFLGRHQFFTGELVRYQTAGTAIGGLTSGSFYKVIVTSDGLGIKLAPMNDPGARLTSTRAPAPPLPRTRLRRCSGSRSMRRAIFGSMSKGVSAIRVSFPTPITAWSSMR